MPGDDETPNARLLVEQRRLQVEGALSRDRGCWSRSSEIDCSRARTRTSPPPVSTTRAMKAIKRRPTCLRSVTRGESTAEPRSLGPKPIRFEARADRYALGPCGCSSMARVPAFQAGYAGSIPVTRSSEKPRSEAISGLLTGAAASDLDPFGHRMDTGRSPVVYDLQGRFGFRSGLCNEVVHLVGDGQIVSVVAWRYRREAATEAWPCRFISSLRLSAYVAKVLE